MKRLLTFAPAFFVFGVTLNLLLTDASLPAALARGAFITVFWVFLMSVPLLLARRSQR